MKTQVQSSQRKMHQRLNKQANQQPEDLKMQIDYIIKELKEIKKIIN